MFASRMRLSAAFLLTTCDCASEMAKLRRFCRIPTEFCTSPRVSMAPEISPGDACASGECVHLAPPRGVEAQRPGVGRAAVAGEDAVGRRRFRAHEHRETGGRVEATDR